MPKITEHHIRIRKASEEAKVSRTYMFYMSLPEDNPEKRYTPDPVVARVAAKWLGGRPADYMHHTRRAMFIKVLPDLGKKIKPVRMPSD